MFSKFISLGSAYAFLCLVFFSLTINFVLADSQTAGPLGDAQYSDPIFAEAGEVFIPQESHVNDVNHEIEAPIDLLGEPVVEAPLLSVRQSVQSSVSSATGRYVLDTGDVLRIIVFGEAELTGSYEVGPMGTISVPLIGDVQVKGLTAGEVNVLIYDKLADGYLIDPSVSIEITNLRPFFILGEVRTPGSYTFIPDMSVLNAVAVAGGFTYRANQKEVDIVRKSKKGQEKKKKLLVVEKVKPGDIIFIKERFF